MRREVKLALILAMMSGTVAAIVTYDANKFLPEQEEAVHPVVDLELAKVVVAKEPLKFGSVLTKFKLEEVQWPVASVPPGSYSSIDDLFAEQLNRSALFNVEKGEAVLKTKITGPGQRASLAAMLVGGKKAVAIRVNEVVGVSGFVLPGDRVDILITRDEKQSGGEKGGAYTDILQQNVRVLAVDQNADGKLDAPVLARTVTVEATLEEAQRITLGATVGDLSLVLREEGGNGPQAAAERVTVADLAGDSGEKQPAATFQPTIAVAPQPRKNDSVTITVVRSGVPTDTTVKRSASSD